MKLIPGSLKRHLVGTLGAVALASSISAQANLINGIVDVWNVNVNAVFQNVVFAPNATGTIVTPTSLMWGTSTGQGQSGLDLTNNPSNTQVATNGPAVLNIGATHLNRPITGNSLHTVDIMSTLTLTPFMPPSLGLPPTSITFHVRFEETPNGNNPCVPGNGLPRDSGVNANGCADIFVIDHTALNFPFFYDLDGPLSLPNQQYFISFFESTTGLNPLPATACASVGVASPCLGFLTPEAQDTSIRFAAVITTTPVAIVVPEPATLLTLSLGLLAMGWSLRRRNA